jgi:hypothetical protein
MPITRPETEYPPLAGDPDFFSLLTGSYARLLGTALVPVGSGPRWLYREAPFVLLAHNEESDPRFVYANLAAQACFGYSWNEFIGLQSRRSADTSAQAERERLLDTVSQTGFVRNYRGTRVTKSGRHFMIEGGIVWQLLDEAGVSNGQAATFSQNPIRLPLP